MRAIRSHVAGGTDNPDSLRLDLDVPEPVPGAGEVLLRVKAVGLNYPDTLIIRDKYQFKPPRPFSPGIEGAGVVEAVGPGVMRLKPGDRVMATGQWGMLSEKVCVLERNCIVLADNVPDDEAAALLITYATDHYAYKLANLKAGERVLILGAAGGVGLAGVQLAKAAGAYVIAGAASAERAEIARQHGADALLVYPRTIDTPDAARAFTSQIREIAPDGAIDVILDPVGGPYAEPAFRCMAWGGRYLVIGFTAGIPKMPLNLALLKGASMIGVFWGAYNDAFPEDSAKLSNELAAMHAKGVIKPLIGMRVPLEEAHTGFKALEDRSVIGKIVVTL
jgi:NADPH2:quinone reductase